MCQGTRTLSLANRDIDVFMHSITGKKNFFQQVYLEGNGKAFIIIPRYKLELHKSILLAPARIYNLWKWFSQVFHFNKVLTV